MCLGCLDEDEPPATRREFLSTALQLTAASALGATAVADAAARVWDIEARGLAPSARYVMNCLTFAINLMSINARRRW